MGESVQMTYFGPVSEAAHGGHANPFFDLTVGLIVLALTWIGYAKKKGHNKPTIWAAIGISAICGVFIYFGIAALIR